MTTTFYTLPNDNTLVQKEADSLLDDADPCATDNRMASTGEGHVASSSSPSSVHTMPTTVQGRVDMAKALKMEGNELFERHEWKKAIKKYCHATMFSKGIMDKLDFIPGLESAAGRLKPTEEQKKEAINVMVAVTNNLAGDHSSWHLFLPHPPCAISWLQTRCETMTGYWVSLDICLAIPGLVKPTLYLLFIIWGGEGSGVSSMVSLACTTCTAGILTLHCYPWLLRHKKGSFFTRNSPTFCKCGDDSSEWLAASWGYYCVFLSSNKVSCGELNTTSPMCNQQEYCNLIELQLWLHDTSRIY